MPFRYRSAITGEYVTAEYAELHPRETIGERVTPAKADRIDLELTLRPAPAPEADPD